MNNKTIGQKIKFYIMFVSTDYILNSLQDLENLPIYKYILPEL